ncbi:MAG: tetratricopeptide repeat protein [Ignavibacteriaceae bacterium]|jgi:tetratricopeptide (TPR) repeat protein|nr:tetratricopeptide repeat protein [Ignavibacteriaceae bacterium]
MTHSEACDILGIKEGADPDVVTKAFNKLNSDLTRQIDNSTSKFLRETLFKNKKALEEAYKLLIKGSETEGSISFSDAYALLVASEDDPLSMIEAKFVNLKEEYGFGLRAPNKKIREIAAADIQILTGVFEHIISNIKKPKLEDLPQSFVESIRDEARSKLKADFEVTLSDLTKTLNETTEKYQDEISSLVASKKKLLNDLLQLFDDVSKKDHEYCRLSAAKLEEKHQIGGLLSKIDAIFESGIKTLPKGSQIVQELKNEPDKTGFGIENVNIEIADENIDKFILKQSKMFDPKPTPQFQQMSEQEESIDSKTVAEKLFSEGRYQDALFYFKEAKSDQPLDYSLEVYIQELEHLVNQPVDDESATNNKGFENYELEAYEEVLRDANNLRSAKNFPAALEIYNTLLVSDPENPYLLYCKTECEDGIKRSGEKKPAAAANVRQTTTEMLTLKRTGDEFFNQKKFNEALGYYRQALKLNPDDIYLQIIIDQCTKAITNEN